MDETIQTITPAAAFAMLNESPRCLLVDIRSSMEYLFVGHPVGAVHIPWIDEPDWVVNPRFTTEIRQLVLGSATCGEDESHCTPVILICRSGKRSKKAAEQLLQDGLRDIYHIDEGFEGELDENHQRSTTSGWRFHQLPWEQC